MALKDLVIEARSCRRFREDDAVDAATLAEAVDLVRFVPSSANWQPLRYAISASRELNARIFPHIGWAGQLKDWKGPAEGERPPAYIVVAGDLDKALNHQVDLGIAAQTINLALAERGLSACMLGNVNFKAVHALLDLPDTLAVLLVIAVGKKAEKVVLDPMEPGGGTSYWRDAGDVHHVPKRGLDDALIRRYE